VKCIPNHTIGELSIQVGGVGGLKQLLITVKEDDKVEKAFGLMEQYKVHGIPVLDASGRIVGNISVTDLQVDHL
jgi:CBS domain-containing protein